MRKYRNKPVTTADGKFDSQAEYKDYQILKLREKAGEVRNIKRQVVYYFGNDEDGYVVFDNGRKMFYRADFVFEESIDPRGRVLWNEVIQDKKGYKDSVYPIKKALMRYFHGVIIRET